MLTLTSCPECDAPAEIAQRMVLASTDGPIEHAKIRCVNRHWFVLPLQALDAAAPGGARTRADDQRVVARRRRHR